MQTIVDVDEKILNLAEQKARCEGKTLGALVEEALRSVLQSPQPLVCDKASASVDAGLNADDPFFRALDEVRAMGGFPSSHRPISFQ